MLLTVRLTNPLRVRLLGTGIEGFIARSMPKVVDDDVDFMPQLLVSITVTMNTINGRYYEQK